MFKGIQTQQTIGYGVKRRKLYYMDLESKLSRRLQQALIPWNENYKLKFYYIFWLMKYNVYIGQEYQLAPKNHVYKISIICMHL